MNIRCSHAWRGQSLDPAPIEEHVDGIALKMSTLHQDIARSHPVKAASGFLHRPRIPDVDPRQNRGFLKIRCEEQRKRQERVLKHFFTGMLQQVSA